MFLFFGLLAWVIGISAASVHNLIVQHVPCSEHGDIVEVAHGELRVAVDVDTISAADHGDSHEHGCLFSSSIVPTLPSIPELPPAILDTKPLTLVQVLCSAGPRSPPLQFAPKTSPPLLT